jgi:hypothetical protein
VSTNSANSAIVAVDSANPARPGRDVFALRSPSLAGSPMGPSVAGLRGNRPTGVRAVGYERGQDAVIVLDSGMNSYWSKRRRRRSGPVTAGVGAASGNHRGGAFTASPADGRVPQVGGVG